MIKIFILVILLVFNSFASLLEDAHSAYKNGDIKIAIKLYKESARKNNDEAYFKLGTIYYIGKVVKRDINKAMDNFKKAASYDHIKSKYNVAVIYGLKQYKFHSYKKAYKILLKLAQDGHAKAQNKVGQYLLHGLGVDKDYKQSVKWFEQSYFKGKYNPASCNLALMYATGKGVFVNLGRARVLAQDGYKNNIPMCVKLYKDFNLHKYNKDKGFKFGFYN